MKIGIIGAGGVGQLLGIKFVQLGHDVFLGTRNPAKLDEKRALRVSLKEWLAEVEKYFLVPNQAQIMTPKEVALKADLLINATPGTVSIEALQAAGVDKVGEKILIDLANELDLSRGPMPYVLANEERCLGEKIQKAFPNLKVVKTLNTVSIMISMQAEALNGGDYSVFLSGNDGDAKNKVAELLKTFGMKNLIDLGDISTSRGPEMFFALFLRPGGGKRMDGDYEGGFWGIKVV